MNRSNRRHLRLLALSLVLAGVGCRDRIADKAKAPSIATPRETGPPATDPSEREFVPTDKRVAIAAKAKDALFAKLSGRLMEVLESGGPVAAIDVCSKEASSIAEAVGKDHGVDRKNFVQVANLRACRAVG